MRRTIFFLWVCSLLTACASPTDTSSVPTSIPETSSAVATSATEATMSLELTSDAFVNGQSIPAKYSCVGKNISPALAWNDPPEGTQSFALIVDDPDAPMGTWVHWVLYNILPTNAVCRKTCRSPARTLTRMPSSWARIHLATYATMVPVHRAARIVITSNSTRWIPPSIFCRAPPRKKSSRKCRDTSWPRAN